ncbi:hypothetical protein [Erythrobacter rubeus]|uniref:DUF3325 domain-containing protein n=1 Tax=Erythrobacter rubeus TaxID=2760803 RepID=A0ABR8KQE1_9SPHN|nr:hypothetical protein [Erythrobacter rubeus]MBD2842976.1 hypothetical protein [Erythrobacter rubeus]
MIFHYVAAIQILVGFVGWGLLIGVSSSVERLTNDPSNDLKPISLKILWLAVMLICIASALILIWPHVPEWIEIALYLTWATMSAAVLAFGRAQGAKTIYLLVSTPILIALGIMI